MTTTGFWTVYLFAILVVLGLVLVTIFVVIVITFIAGLFRKKPRNTQLNKETND